MLSKKRFIIFWIVWGIGFAALTLGLIKEFIVGRTLEAYWIMALGHSYASSAIIAGMLKRGTFD